MPVHIPLAQPKLAQPKRRKRLDGPWLSLAAASLAILAAAAACLAWLPRPLLLPSLSIVILLLAAAAAGVAWASAEPTRRDGPTHWDLAGALTLIGFAAALLSDPAEVVPLLEARRTP